MEAVNCFSTLMTRVCCVEDSCGVLIFDSLTLLTKIFL